MLSESLKLTEVDRILHRTRLQNLNIKFAAGAWRLSRPVISSETVDSCCNCFVKRVAFYLNCVVDALDVAIADLAKSHEKSLTVCLLFAYERLRSFLNVSLPKPAKLCADVDSVS